MLHSIVRAASIAAATLVFAIPSIAAETKPSTATEPAPKAASTDKSTAAKAKAAAPVKLVDINTAGKAELKRLPGIGDAEADKIIAGRPYHSKADLFTHGILPRGTYEGLKRQVVAKPKPV